MLRYKLNVLTSQSVTYHIFFIAWDLQLQHLDDELRTASLYIIMLKKDESGLTQFINCLHMTGNHVIANIIEAKLDLLVENLGYVMYPQKLSF